MSLSLRERERETAAINLAKAGYEVEVYERKEVVGRRFNGDLQGLENWSDEGDVRKKLKSMNIKTNFDISPFRKFTISNGLRVVNFSLERPAFYLVRRGTVSEGLDRGLKEQALDLGVDIHFSESEKMKMKKNEKKKMKMKREREREREK
ncbi:hypothetical protein AKJ37_04725, partial [candidate division MSBL1 archaeon SCGC-AAA259I09]